jgi:F-type H+-transporting ATPase subunit c
MKYYMDTTMMYIAAWIAVWVTGLAVTAAEAWVAKTAVDAQGKNPDLGSTLRSLTILGLALVESAAIYGLVVMILILQKIGVDGFTGWQAMGAAMSIALPGVLAGLGEGAIVVNAIKSILRNPSDAGNIRTNMIIFIAIVESAAIYGLVSAILILNK